MIDYTRTVESLRGFGCPKEVALYLSQYISVRDESSPDTVKKVIKWAGCTRHCDLGDNTGVQHILTPEHILLRTIHHNPNWVVFDIVTIPSTLFVYKRKMGFTYWSDGIPQRIIQYCEATKKNSISVLDVGCNDGKSTYFLKRDLQQFGIVMKPTGVDTDDVWKYYGEEFIQGDILNLPVTTKYDVVVWGISGHLGRGEDWPKRIRASIHHMKNDGIFLFPDLLYNHFTSYDISKSKQVINYWDSMSNLRRAWYIFSYEAFCSVYCNMVSWDRNPVCIECEIESLNQTNSK